MIEFTLPYFYHLIKINNNLIQLYRNHPEYFKYKNIGFKAEGTFPYFYWSANNSNNIRNSPLVTRMDIINLMNVTNHPFILDCSNPHITPIDLLDCKNSAILDIFNNGSNQLEITNPEISKYFSKHFPEYRLIGSPLYYLFDENKEHLDELYLIKQNHITINHEYFKSIPKSKISLCIFSLCSSCPQQNKCYVEDAAHRFAFSEKGTFLNCQNKKFLTINDDLFSQYLKMGYKNFYFDASGIPYQDEQFFINMYVSFFIKSDYQEKALLTFEKGD